MSAARPDKEEALILACHEHEVARVVPTRYLGAISKDKLTCPICKKELVLFNVLRTDQMGNV